MLPHGQPLPLLLRRGAHGIGNARRSFCRSPIGLFTFLGSEMYSCTRKAFEGLCFTSAGAVVRASSGERDRQVLHVGSLCWRSALWSSSAAVHELSAALVSTMTVSDVENRELVLSFKKSDPFPRFPTSRTTLQETRRARTSDPIALLAARLLLAGKTTDSRGAVPVNLSTPPA